MCRARTRAKSIGAHARNIKKYCCVHLFVCFTCTFLFTTQERRKIFSFSQHFVICTYCTLLSHHPFSLHVCGPLPMLITHSKILTLIKKLLGDRDSTICTHTIYPDKPTVLVVKDTLQDDRFKDFPSVTGPPHVRYLVCIPVPHLYVFAVI